MCCDADEGLLCKSVQCYHHRGHRYHICITKIAHAAWLSNSQVRAISISNRPLNSINSAFKCNLNSASKCNLNSAMFTFSQRSLKIGESFRSGTSLISPRNLANQHWQLRNFPIAEFLLNSSQPSNSTTLSAELSNRRSILQFLR